MKLFYTSPRVINEAILRLQDREKLVDCQKHLDQKYLRHCNTSFPLAWVTCMVDRLIVYKVWLLVHYPMMRQDWTTFGTTVSREHLLMTSITIMELSYKLEINKVKQYRWLFNTYVQ
jgi:hypothetical protein